MVVRRVSRCRKPESLRNNASRWRRELQGHLESVRNGENQLQHKYYNRYKKRDIQAALADMYAEYCCYCEGNVPLKPETSFGHIEHRLPKDEFPELTYEWQNLHWGCQACNTNKGNKYDQDAPAVDAVMDEPKDHLTYDLSSYDKAPMVKPLTARGETTVDYTQLNRERLLGARKDVLLWAMIAIFKVRDAASVEEERFARRDLERMTGGQYGSVIRWAMDNYLSRADDELE